jgi:hypothetical protein
MWLLHAAISLPGLSLPSLTHLYHLPTMSLASMISQSKEALETLMITIPDGVADDSDYEIWVKKFSALLVRPP